MEITFYGAVREVTGSMHLLSCGPDRILFDCGMFQGHRAETRAKNSTLPFDPQLLTNIVLSHAHIDHSGRIPLLTRDDFAGRVVCTRATAAACEYLLPDSAHIQESDAAYLNYKTARGALARMGKSGKAKSISKSRKKEIRKLLKRDRHRLNSEAIDSLIGEHRLEGVQPLYTSEDARRALSYLDGHPYRESITVGAGMTCRLYDAGHILGSAITVVRATENGRQYTVGYTGDIGRFDKPILEDPTLDFAAEDRSLDLLVMESTYGDRIHAPTEELKPQLKRVLVDTCDRGGTVVIPSFAFGRTQELIYLLHELRDEGEVPQVPVFVDSPLATNITRVFGEHPEVYDREAREEFLERGENPFSFEGIHFTQSVEESMELNRMEDPHVVISASGMCEAGRILHHLRYRIHDPRSTILIVGYMAQHTLGRRILDSGLAYEREGRKGPPPLLRFLNKEYPLKARVVSIGGFSAHGDREELLRFLKDSNLSVKRIAVVHGEQDQSLALAKRLEAEGFDPVVPRVGQTIPLK